MENTKIPAVIRQNKICKHITFFLYKKINKKYHRLLDKTKQNKKIKYYWPKDLFLMLWKHIWNSHKHKISTEHEVYKHSDVFFP